MIRTVSTGYYVCLSLLTIVLLYTAAPYIGIMPDLPISAAQQNNNALHYITVTEETISTCSDRSLSKGKDVVVCLPGARIEHVTERVKKIMGRGNGGSIVVHVGTNNADKEGTTAILEKYRDLLKKTKQARVGQIIISGISPVFGNKIQGYRNSKRMAVNGMVERLCKEEDVGYMDLWDSFVGNEDMYLRDGLHLSGKGAAVFAEGLSGAVASGLGKVRYLN